VKNNNILYAKEGNTCYLKLKGDIRYTLSTGFNKLFREHLSNKDVTNVIIDLRSLNYIDSTNLGIIALIARDLIKRQSKKPTIISDNPSINTLLESIHFNKVCMIEHQWDYFPDVLIDCDAMDSLNKNVIIDSHKALTDLDESNQDAFSKVVETLGKETKSKKKSG